MLKFLDTTIVILLLLVWITWPSARSYETTTCSPDGFVASLNAWFHGNRFRREQLGAAEKQRDFIRSWDTKESQRKEQEEALNAKIKEFMMEHRKRKPTREEIEAGNMREEARRLEDAATQVELRGYFVQHLRELERCESITRQKLRLI